MVITEKEVRRIVSLHFKNRYNIDARPDGLTWQYDYRDGDVSNLVIAIDVVGDGKEGD